MSHTHHHAAIVRLPFGAVGIDTTNDAISRITFLPPDTPEQAAVNALAQRASEALRHYADDPDWPLELPVLLLGTAYQRRVWQTLQTLHRGETISYGELAEKLDSGARAIGNACRHNPVPLFVPCHRVVAKHGMGGFAGNSEGGWTAVKRWLLAHEAAF